jgi:hypothetical protein
MRLEPIRKLTLERPPARGLPAFLSAASGLVHAGQHLYVIGDDLHHLGVFRANSAAPGSLVRLFPGAVAAGQKARKKRKRDLESIALLPAFPGYPHGALLALGSGSRKKRSAGAIVALDARQAVVGDPMLIDLAPLYAPLAREFGDLNIEGAFVTGHHVALLQRGVGGEARNARARVRLAPLLEAIATGRPPPSSAVQDVTDYELGKIDGIPLAFTDGATMRGGAFAFTAAAEETGDAYADGHCAGSAIGIIAGDDTLRALWRLTPPLKVEGIAVMETHREIALRVVTDADDPAIPAQLLGVTLRDPHLPRRAPSTR